MSLRKRRYPELNALKGLLREKKTSYRKVSSGLGISVTSFSNKINDFNNMTLFDLLEITKLLDINPRDAIKYFFSEASSN